MSMLLRGGDEVAPVAPARAIDRSSPLPYYHQLKEILREQVVSGALRPGDRLDGEHVLCLTYGVSRTVVRQALADLHRENVLDRQKGRGTFVAPERTSQSLVQSLNGLFDDIKILGRTLRSDVRRLAVELADTDVAARLQLEPESPVVVIERLRFVDDEPWVFTVSHVPLQIAPDLIEQDLREDSLYRLLRERYGQQILHSHRVVEARRSQPTLARDLQIADGDPVLTLTNIAYGAKDLPIETFVAYHRADRSRFEVNISQSQDGAPTAPLVHLV